MSDSVGGSSKPETPEEIANREKVEKEKALDATRRALSPDPKLSEEIITTEETFLAALNAFDPPEALRTMHPVLFKADEYGKAIVTSGNEVLRLLRESKSYAETGKPENFNRDSYNTSIQNAMSVHARNITQATFLSYEVTAELAKLKEMYPQNKKGPEKIKEFIYGKPQVIEIVDGQIKVKAPAIQDASTLAITSVQRLPRYELFSKEILKKKKNLSSEEKKQFLDPLPPVEQLKDYALSLNEGIRLNEGRQVLQAALKELKKVKGTKSAFKLKDYGVEKNKITLDAQDKIKDAIQNQYLDKIGLSPEELTTTLIYLNSRTHDSEIVPMSTLPDGQPGAAKLGKFYLDNDGNYVVIDPHGKLNSGNLKDLGFPEEDIKKLASMDKDPKVKERVLKVLSEKGLIRKNKGKRKEEASLLETMNLNFENSTSPIITISLPKESLNKPEMVSNALEVGSKLQEKGIKVQFSESFNQALTLSKNQKFATTRDKILLMGSKEEQEIDLKTEAEPLTRVSISGDVPVQKGPAAATSTQPSRSKSPITAQNIVEASKNNNFSNLGTPTHIAEALTHLNKDELENLKKSGVGIDLPQKNLTDPEVIAILQIAIVFDSQKIKPGYTDAFLDRIASLKESDIKKIDNTDIQKLIRFAQIENAKKMDSTTAAATPLAQSTPAKPLREQSAGSGKEANTPPIVGLTPSPSTSSLGKPKPLVPPPASKRVLPTIDEVILAINNGTLWQLRSPEVIREAFKQFKANGELDKLKGINLELNLSEEQLGQKKNVIAALEFVTLLEPIPVEIPPDFILKGYKNLKEAEIPKDKVIDPSIISVLNKQKKELEAVPVNKPPVAAPLPTNRLGVTATKPPPSNPAPKRPAPVVTTNASPNPGASGTKPIPPNNVRAAPPPSRSATGVVSSASSTAAPLVPPPSGSSKPLPPSRGAAPTAPVTPRILPASASPSAASPAVTPGGAPPPLPPLHQQITAKTSLATVRLPFGAINAALKEGVSTTVAEFGNRTVSKQRNRDKILYSLSPFSEMKSPTANSEIYTKLAEDAFKDIRGDKSLNIRSQFVITPGESLTNKSPEENAKAQKEFISAFQTEMNRAENLGIKVRIQIGAEIKDIIPEPVPTTHVKPGGH